MHNYPASVSADMVESSFHGSAYRDAPCEACNGTGFICDDCGESKCDCKPYELDGETFVPESSHCRGCTPPKVRR